MFLFFRPNGRSDNSSAAAVQFKAKSRVGGITDINCPPKGGQQFLREIRKIVIFTRGLERTPIARDSPVLEALS
jgi:hypothetical protein